MRQANKNRVFSMLAALGLIVAGSTARAAVVIDYGNFFGNHVEYIGVTESDNTLPPPTVSPLYGTPTIGGDTLSFHPLNFSAAITGDNTELQDGRLTMDIRSVNNQSSLPPISITEGGAWFVSKGTDLTLSEEALIVNAMFITSVDGASVDPILVTPTISFTHTQSGSVTVASDSDSIEFASTGGVANGSWNATADFNLAAALSAAGLTGNITGLSLDLDDQLIASGDQASSSAFIDKKFANIGPETSIPEPTTASLLIVTASGLLARRNRRSQKQA